MVSILELYRDPRDRFIKLLTGDIRDRALDIESGHPLIDFVIRWAHCYLCLSTASYDEEWARFIDEVMRSVAHTGEFE